MALFNKEIHLRLLNSVNFNEVETSIDKLFQAANSMVKTVREEIPDIYYSHREGDVIISETVKDKVTDFYFAVMNVKEQFIDTAIVYGSPFYSSSLNSEELSSEISKFAQDLRYKNIQYAMPIDKVITKREDNKYQCNFNELLDLLQIHVFSHEVVGLEKNKNAELNNIFQNMTTSSGNALLSSLNSLKYYMKNQFSGEKDLGTTMFLDQMNKSKDVIKYAKKFLKSVKETSEQKHQFINDELEKLSDEHKINIHFSGMTRGDERFINLYQRMKNSVVEMGRQLEITKKLYGVGDVNKNLSILGQGFDQDALGIFESNHEKGLSIIKTSLTNDSKSVLVHECTHFRDYSQNILNKNLYDVIASKRSEMGLNRLLINSSFASDEVMKDIIKNLNENHKYKPLTEICELKEYVDIKQKAREIFNLQMFGKENVSNEELKCSDKYTQSVKEVSAILAKDLLDNICCQSLGNEIIDKIYLDPKGEKALLESFQLIVESSALPHLVISAKKANSTVDYKIDGGNSGASTLGFFSMDGIKSGSSENVMLIEESERMVGELRKLLSRAAEMKDIDSQVPFLDTDLGIKLVVNNVNDKKNELSNCVKKLSSEDLPTQIGVLTEDNIIVTPINYSNIKVSKELKAIAEKKIYREEFQDYLRKPHEILARNSESLAAKLMNSKTATNRFIQKTINVLSCGKIGNFINNGYSAVKQEEITETTAYKLVSKEKEITELLEKLSENPNLIKEYFEGNPDKLKEAINFGNEFSLNRKIMEIFTNSFDMENEKVEETGLVMKKTTEIASKSQIFQSNGLIDKIKALEEKREGALVNDEPLRSKGLSL